jgi:hypothetical protein
MQTSTARVSLSSCVSRLVGNKPLPGQYRGTPGR